MRRVRGACKVVEFMLNASPRPKSYCCEKVIKVEKDFKREKKRGPFLYIKPRPVEKFTFS
jgi:hypothetical protein